MKTVVLQLRYAISLVGQLADTGDDTGEIALANAHVVRVWGTDQDLAQLSLGPRENTVLDRIVPNDGYLRVPLHGLIETVECEEEPWAEILGANKPLPVLAPVPVLWPGMPVSELPICILQLVESINIVGIPLDDGRESGQIVVAQAHAIREWGTKAGLGELVGGPTGKTALKALIPDGDDLRIPYGALLMWADANAEAWRQSVKASAFKLHDTML